MRKLHTLAISGNQFIQANDHIIRKMTARSDITSAARPRR